MNTTASKRETRTAVTTADAVEKTIEMDATERLERIRTLAYYKAEARQFAPGHELEDWVQATVEFDAVASQP